MSIAETASRILDSLIPRLQAEGYDVYVRPARYLLPPFMGNYTPDAIALGSPKNLAIEIAVKDPSSTLRLGSVRERFETAKDWELRVYYAPTADEQIDVDVVSREAIERSLGEVERLVADGRLRPGLLMVWSIFEAIGRILAPTELSRPQTPMRLVEVLAADGHVTPSQADLLRRLAPIRNHAAHGDLDVAVGIADLNQAVAILKSLASSLPRT
jgi:uncharacterized protein YutE (UPF0331/DUF86 family)